MKCVQCGFDNAPDARFCEECGQVLSRVCPNCQQPVSAIAKFCKNCGFSLAQTATKTSSLDALRQSAPQIVAEKILAEHTRPAGERRLVTALFTDIVGSTSLAEKRDPEEWREIVTGAHQRVGEAIYRYEGTIAQLLGDGVLAFFGAPIAHEDDAERAIRAALDILAAIQQYAVELRTTDRVANFQMRVGLNTGLVVVGHIGHDLHMEYTAIGDTINLAARMQSAAEPNSILIADNTYRLAEPLFDFEDRGLIDVKGKAEPVHVFRVLRAREGVIHTRGIAGLDSPLVGRARDLHRLQACFEEVQQGHGQIVSVVGEAGLGKSRLIAEMRKGLTTQADLLWLEGRSLSYETATPYAPFIDLLSRLFDLRADDTEAEKVQKIAAWNTDRAPFLAALLGIAVAGEAAERLRYLEPPALRERVFQAVLDTCEELTQTRSVVLVFEDLHWIDATSLELLERLLALTDRAPLLIVALFRLQRQEPAWHFHEAAARDYAHRYTTIMLEPLTDEQARELVGNLLHIEDLPETVRALILRKAEGNPFFVEEVIRTLLDAHLVVRENSHWRATREIENIAVPDTLAGVIMARLDKLDDETRHVAQTAAVIGREFQFNVLRDVNDDAAGIDQPLVMLQRRELIREKSQPLARTYRFKHALIQETAYGSILISRRRELHRRVAECLEQIAPDRVNDLARHWLEAQDETRALPYLVQSGERAARAYATAAALDTFTRAIELLGRVENLELARRAYEGLGGVLMVSGQLPQASDNYHTMLHYAEAHGDLAMQVSALNKLSTVAMYLGQFDLIDQHLNEAEQLARQGDDRPGLAEMYMIRCMVCLSTADFDGATKYLGESVEAGRQLQIKELMAFGLAHLSNTLVYLTRFDEAWETAQNCLRVSREIGDRAHVIDVLAQPITYCYLRQGDLAAAQQSAEESAHAAAPIGYTIGEAIANLMLTLILRERGAFQQAYEASQRALTMAQEFGHPLFIAMALSQVGTALLNISPTFDQEIMAAHTQAAQLLETPIGQPAGGLAWVELGFCVLAKGQIDLAHDYFQKGLTVPTTQMLLNRPHFLLGEAEVALARGQLANAQQLASEARTFVEERAMKHLYPRVAMLEAKIDAACGEPDRALTRFGQAETRALEMGQRPLLLQAREGAAHILQAMGRSHEAEEQQAAAQAMRDELAALFTDEQLRALYVDHGRA